MERLIPETNGVLGDVRIGIESEALRVRSDGSLSRSRHPFPLDDRRFTMDFAESQLEIVTEPLSGPQSALNRLKELTGEALAVIFPETLWPFSMPPEMPPDEEIALADFGRTEEGRRARLYRQGLAVRYGKARQMISGIHVNISAGPNLSALAWRNSSSHPLLSAAAEFYRNLGSLILFTGASPIRSDGIGEPVVSYRCGSGGYGGAGFSDYLDLSSVNAYTHGVEAGIRKGLPAGTAGRLVADGRVLQLSKSVFQSESEYYAPVRLRRALHHGAAQSLALRRDGPEYIELRFLDRNPFAPAGIDGDTLKLVHLVFLKGITYPSAAPDKGELRHLLQDARDLAGTPLEVIVDTGNPDGRYIRDSAAGLLNDLRPIADRLDSEETGSDYRTTLERYEDQLARPEKLLSAAVYIRYRDSGKNWNSQGSLYIDTVPKETAHELSHAGV